LTPRDRTCRCTGRRQAHAGNDAGHPPIRRPLPHPTHHHRLSRVLTGRDDAEEEVRLATDTLTASEVDLDRLAVDTVRVLAMDAIQKAGSGHPGTAMALAPACGVRKPVHAARRYW
jgi:hypothetical protein